jgi:bacteriocin biosynthesis cyclodehydratase domain-containing protein
MHPLLAPGTHLLRRGDGRIQLGLDPALATRLSPEEADADSMSPRHGSPALRSRHLRARLVDQRLAAEDDTALRRALPADVEDNRWQRHTLAALFREDPALLEARLAERTSKRFRVRGFGHPLDDGLREDLFALLRRSGLTPSGPKPPGPPRRDQIPTEPVHVLLGVGEPSRELTDALMREAVSHLVVRLTEGRAVIGPFVLPGLTPCLRCLDAHRAEDDPSWPLLVEQYSRASRRDRADGVPEPVDATLAASAVAWAVRELTAYAEGGTPGTLGRTVVLAARSGETETHPWWPHPQCGCGWSSAPRVTVPA